MFLLVPDHYGKTMTKIIDIQIIEELYRPLKEKYVDADICISDELQLGVTKVLRKLVVEDRKASRRDSKLELLVLSQVFEEDERVLVDVIRNCIQKLPSTDATHEIREMKLITTFIDPVLATMLNRPETKKCFRWLNQQVIEYGAEPTNLRPDAIMMPDPIWHETYAVGYCEVKANALDRGEVKCTLGVQVVGKVDFS
ncbi:hypothetical protein CU098_011848 [Rhizopus stolonifer]|uniref:Uncharacterized protein n=1 Tax=Rhizopus stolonifer TaxID=4846 RepID=A0A367KNX1_RHIST|nr:hypothetical protein CU098_011848 [Rhizopus stolonifer]